MIASLCRPLKLCQRQARTTWVFKHALPIPTTGFSGVQRSPLEKQLYQCYEVVQSPDTSNVHHVSLILLENVEGIGRAMDVVEVASEVAHEQLLLPKKAVYASPFNVTRYAISKEKLLDKGKPYLTFEYRTSRMLHSSVVIVNMSMDNEWQLEKWHVVVSLRRMGFSTTEECILLAPGPIRGPDIDLEAKLFRFYVVINGRLIVPCLARLQQISARTARRILTPGLDPRRVTDEELKMFNIQKETVYEAPKDSLSSMSDQDVFNLMQARCEPE